MSNMERQLLKTCKIDRFTHPVVSIYTLTGAQVALRGYENPMSIDKRNTLSFLYKIGAGEETPNGKILDLAINSTIQLNGGFITSSENGLDVDLLTMPYYGTPGTRFCAFPMCVTKCLNSR